MGLVLSIFPGIDLLGRAFEEQGFCVVRGPDILWGGNIYEFHPPAGIFEGIIGGPPCIGESRWANLNANKGYTLWPEAMRVINEAKPAWWILEAVSEHKAPFCVCLSPRWLGEKQSRKRYFHSNLNLKPHIEVCLFEHPLKEPCVTASEYSKGLRIHSVKNMKYIPTREWEKLVELQGLPPGFDIPCFTKAWKGTVLGNGVPMSMGRAIAKSIKRCSQEVMEF